MRICEKYDEILHRDLTAQERLEPCRVAVRFMHRSLDSLEHVIRNASNDLTEEQLQLVADAVQVACNAVDNAAFLGDSDYQARPVRLVKWEGR